LYFLYPSGEGINSITKSSMVCTPLFLKDEPQTIGTIFISSKPDASALIFLFSDCFMDHQKISPLNLSSNSETDSIISLSIPVLHPSYQSGIGTSVKVIPLSAHSKQ
jgi:hypothetical protein